MLREVQCLAARSRRAEGCQLFPVNSICGLHRTVEIQHSLPVALVAASQPHLQRLQSPHAPLRRARRAHRNVRPLESGELWAAAGRAAPTRPPANLHLGAPAPPRRGQAPQAPCRPAHHAAQRPRCTSPQVPMDRHKPLLAMTVRKWMHGRGKVRAGGCRRPPGCAGRCENPCHAWWRRRHLHRRLPATDGQAQADGGADGQPQSVLQDDGR